MSSNEQMQTILVVDDAPENIDVLSGILRGEYKVRAAINGEKALAIAMSDKPPDLVLLDIMMPGMSGYEVCQRLKAHLPTRHIPVIFCTAMGEVENEQRGFEVGCVDYITKPVSPPLVLARVKTHLALHHQNRVLEGMVLERTQELNATRLAIIRILGKAAEYKDDTTGSHVLRMAHYCKILGLAAGLSETDAEMLAQAAPMHDVGKIGTPDAILKKAGKLTPEEWDIMRLHVENAAHILGDEPSELLQMARTIALTHHEKWDGSGYPKGLRQQEIPLIGRISALADVFDALCSKRPYKPGVPADEVVEIIRKEAGHHFDPMLVEKLIENLPQFLEIRTRFADAPEAA
ncbi:MAG: two-component system response regulator [Pseudomonadota bacterium]